jgi:hypothetical protein
LIRYVERSYIDEERWNGCIQSSFNGNLYGYSWFLDIVAGEWGALVEDDYGRVFPIVHRKKFGISYIYQPFFTQQLGLYSRAQLNSEILDEFIQAIPKRFRQVEINLNTLNKADDSKYKLLSQLNHELDLINDYDKIRAGYSENLLRNIKKAEKAGLSVSKNVRPDDIIDMFRQNRGKEISHLGEKDYLKLKRLAYTAIHKRIADVRGVYDQRNQLCAGAFFFISNRKAVFLFSGLTPEGREAGAMPLLIDSFIRENSGKHLTFDFDGSNDPNLARFYKSFGSKELIYQRLEINRLPGWIRSAVKFLKRLRNR